MRAALLILALGLSACSSSPTAPTPPPAPPLSPLPSNILSISVIGDMWIVTTSTPVQWTARLVTSTTPFDWVDGSDRVTWTVEPAGVVSVDRLGRVTPLSIGTAHVTATLGDKTGGNNVRVLPDYSGEWRGEYVVTGCTGGHDFRECGRIMQGEAGAGIQGGKYPFMLALSQFRDEVTGTLREIRANGDKVAPVTGLVRLNGALVLEASLPQPNHEPFRVINWSSTVNAAATTMSGAFTQFEPRRTAFGDPYVVRMENEFANLARAR